MKHITSLLIFLWLLLTTQGQSISEKNIQHTLDSLREAGNFPGLSIAIVTDNNAIAFTSGFNDKEKQTTLNTSDKFLQGSVGKTYVSAIALDLVKQGKLNLDERVAVYLEHFSWYKRIPNAASITVRMLMNHTSGIMRYEFNPAFTKQLTDNPDKHWRPEELLAFVLDASPNFAAGNGWEYSDTNYILLGMIIEKITGKSYYDLLKEKILEPLQLKQTFPSDSRKLKGLSQGYAGANNPFGGKDKVVTDDGNFIINPQFEWTGGGVYSTTLDLAKWGKLLYSGKIIDTAMLFHNAVAAKLGVDVKYGLGVIIRNTPLGTGYGHSGFFPGFRTELIYFPKLNLCMAVQSNSSDFSSVKLSLLQIAYSIVSSLNTNK